MQKWRQSHANMSHFALKSRAFFKLLWRGRVDRPKTPIEHGRKYFTKNKNTHCAWAKIFFHLWLYGEHTTTAENTKFNQVSAYLKYPITTRIFEIRATYLCGFRDFICSNMESNIFLCNFVSQKGR